MCRSWQLACFTASLTLTCASHTVSDAVESPLVHAATATTAFLDNRKRSLQSASQSDPTINQVDNVIFSRPPYSKQETSSIVFGTAAAFGLLSAIILLVSANLDSGERRRRRARAIVPEESVPCAIAEQYYLDEYLIAMRSSQDFEERKKRMGFCSYVMHYGMGFPDALTRQHLCLSLLVKAIPTFTRLKRGVLIVVQLHLSMLMASFAYNISEHNKPNGKYEMLSCGGSLWSSSCTATLPVSLVVATIAHPVFRFVAVRQMRLTCFFSQSHPSNSQFPLNVRKFARVPAKSVWESLFCMRNSYERRQVQVMQSRSCWHRVVRMLWQTTQPSIKDLRLYGMLTSWSILFLMVSFVVFTYIYVITFSAYLEDDVVYHWLAFTLMMFFSTTFILEPLQILLVEVFWCALVADISQRRGFGAHSLAFTTRYKDVVRQIEQTFIKNLRLVAAMRMQRWWSAVLEMYQAINEQQSMAVNFQAINKKTVHSKKYAKEHKWCMKVEVLECFELEQVTLDDYMSPFIRLQCDTGNPNVIQTKVAWDKHQRAAFNETFFVDIKESRSMYVSAWSKTATSDEFIGRGYFEFGQLKSGDRETLEGQDVRVSLHDIEHGEERSRMKHVRGYVTLRVKFLDPAREICGESDDTDWMLPKHRMQFALSKMGGRMSVSKMLGGLGAPLSAPVALAVPSQPMKLDYTSSGWSVGGRLATPRSPSSSNLNPRAGVLETSRPTSRTNSNSLHPGRANGIPNTSATPPQLAIAGDAHLSLNTSEPSGGALLTQPSNSRDSLPGMTEQGKAPGNSDEIDV